MISKWKCSRCGLITVERESESTTSKGDPMPEFGWGCKTPGCDGQRFLIKKKIIKPITLEKMEELIRKLDKKYLPTYSRGYIRIFRDHSGSFRYDEKGNFERWENETEFRAIFKKYGVKL